MTQVRDGLSLARLAAPWRIFYDDGSTFEGRPEDAPSDGVVVIAERATSIAARKVGGLQRGILGLGLSVVWMYGELYGWTGFGWQAANETDRSWPYGAPVLKGALVSAASFSSRIASAWEWLGDRAP